MMEDYKDSSISFFLISVETCTYTVPMATRDKMAAGMR